MDLRTPPGPETRSNEAEEWKRACFNASNAGDAALRSLAAGLPAHVAALDDYAIVLHHYATRTDMSDGRTITVEHVDLVRRLADLVRAGAPEVDITAAARQVEAALPLAGFRRVTGKLTHRYLFSPLGKATATEFVLEVHHPIRLDDVWSSLVVLHEADVAWTGEDAREVSAATWAGALERAGQTAAVMLDTYVRQHGGGTIADADPGA